MPNTVKRLKIGDVLHEEFIGSGGQFDITVPERATYNACFCVTGQDVNVSVHLTGAYAACDIRFIYMANKAQDNTLFCHIYHEAPDTLSRQIVHGVLTDKSTIRYEGAIHISPNCPRCDGSQNHRAILLSDDAHVFATPELEISTDDVLASHGSAIGNLDEAQLFYLQSRGIDLYEASRMLVTGFLLADMPDSYQKAIEEWTNENV